jgi:hypothetical protein
MSLRLSSIEVSIKSISNSERRVLTRADLILTNKNPLIRISILESSDDDYRLIFRNSNETSTYRFSSRETLFDNIPIIVSDITMLDCNRCNNDMDQYQQYNKYDGVDGIIEKRSGRSRYMNV